VRVLLDTQIVLWAAYSPEKLPRQAQGVLLDESNELFFSTASIWEVSIKFQLNKPDFQVNPLTLYEGLLANDYSELWINARHVVGITSLPMIHKDPFDRLLVAQAKLESMSLLTCDETISRYAPDILFIAR
jgi:PIN domain nuclease of toxin-antitoxin system